MSIQSEICRISSAKQSIVEGLKQKGMEIDDGLRLEEIGSIIKSSNTVVLPEDFIYMTDIGEDGNPRKTVFSGTVLPAYMCYYNTSLEYIELTGDLIEIGNAAFHTCTSLKEIKLPPSLKMVKANAFQGCISLKELWLPGVCAISGASASSSAFRSCSGLLGVTIGGPGDPVLDFSALEAYGFYAASSINSFVIYTADGTGPDNLFYKSSTTTFQPVKYAQA